MIAALLLAVQVASPAVPRPVAGTPPQRIVLTDCPRPTGDDIVVCGQNGNPRLPLPDERGPPDGPAPSNPDLTGGAALAQTVTPCAASQGGCRSGINLFAAGTAAIRLVGKLVDPNSCCDTPGEATSVGALARDIGKAFRKKPDRSKRVAIDLDAPPPSTAGRLAP